VAVPSHFCASLRFMAWSFRLCFVFKSLEVASLIWHFMMLLKAESLAKFLVFALLVKSALSIA
jgi:hypothetical protein